MPTSFSQNNFSLDVFDEPVRKFLGSQIKELGFAPQELQPVVDKAIEGAKKVVCKERLLLPKILKSRIEEHAFHYVHSVLSQSKKWKSAYERINSFHSVFVVGAGISFESGIPLTRVLDDLLRFCGADDYEELSKDQKKCLKFKREFKKICKDKNVGTSHILIAQSFSKYILEIICLNWDNLIEKAAKTLSKEIPKINEDKPITSERFLWKFHGDVENIKGDNVEGKGGWIFPDEEGHVFDCFTRYVDKTGLRDKLFTFVIIGYSENEKEIYDNVVECFEKRPPRPTFRVGLDLSRLGEKDYIVGPSNFVLKKIIPLERK